MRSATRVRVFVGEDERYQGRPLFEAIVLAAREEGLAGATVFKGFMGFDRSSGLLSLRPLRFHADLPAVVEAVGRREEIEAALPGVRRVLACGLITLTEVDLFELTS
jgi:PII-like signaling protein